MQQFVEGLESIDVKYTVAEDAWRLNFVVTGKHLHGEVDETDKDDEVVPQGCAIQVDIQKHTQNEDTVRAVVFTKTAGSQLCFIQRYRELKGVLTGINNADPPFKLEE